MSMWVRQKRKALLFFGGAVLALVLLASSLSRLIFYTPVSLRTNAADAPFEGVLRLPAYGRGGWLLVLFGLIFLSFFLTREGRRFLLLFTLVLAGFFLCLYTARPLEQFAPTTTPTSAASTPIQSIQVTPLPAQTAIALEEDILVANWLVTAFGILGALLITGGLAMIVWLIARRQQSRSIPDLLSQQAQQAADALQAGDDFGDVITRCYARMSQVLQEEHDLERSAAMTPREFEQHLLKLEFPGQPVHSLTLLFEQVRYGHIPPGEADVQQALECLNAIIAHCQALKTE